MVLTGFVVFGVPGALVGLAAAATTAQLPNDPGRALASAALVLFGLSAASTVLAAGPVTIRYAEDRGLAGALAAVGGITLGCALVSGVARERAVAPPTQADGGRTDRGRADGGVPRLRPQALRIACGAGAAVAVAAVVALSGPGPIPDACRDLVGNVANGTGHATGSGPAARPSAACAPAGAVIAAFWPLGAHFALVASAAGTVGAVARLARRQGGRRGGVIGVEGHREHAGVPAVAVAVALALGSAPWWTHDLPTAVAALGSTAAAVLARPTALDARRAVAAGAVIALAALSRPEALVMVPLLAAWGLAGKERPGVPHAARAAILVVTAGVLVLPWALWAHDNVGSWWPIPAGGASLSWALPSAVTLGVATTLLRVGPRRRAWLAWPGSGRARRELRPAARHAREQ